MSNKNRNWEAVNINRALLTEQATSIAECVANWFVMHFFAVDLAQPMRKGAMWTRK